MKTNDLLTIGGLALGGFVLYKLFIKPKAAAATSTNAAQTGLASFFNSFLSNPVSGSTGAVNSLSSSIGSLFGGSSTNAAPTNTTGAATFTPIADPSLGLQSTDSAGQDQGLSLADSTLTP